MSDRTEWHPLKDGEPEEKDFLKGSILLYHIYRGVICGDRKEMRSTEMITHWMAVPRDGWVRASERKPEAEDANIMGCVLANHKEDGIIITGWHQFAWNRELTHWRAVPEGVGG